MGVRALTMRAAVFLDRDGVLDRAIVKGGKPYPPSGLEELEVLPGVAQACAKLQGEGFLLIVVTNQPDVARGTQRREVIEAINQALRAQLPLDDIRVCYHDNSDRCGCRKPAPGLLVEAARDWQIDLASSFMVGDRWVDIEAGRRAGCTCVMIGSGYDEKGVVTPDCSVASMLEAADWITLQRSGAIRKEPA